MRIKPLNTEKGIFSPALFRQSMKSQRVLWLFTTIGNCLISLIVILILSTLTINTTKEGLSNLFSTAEMEHTVKSSAVETYLAYDQSVIGYEGDGESLTSGSVLMYKASQGTMEGYQSLVYDKVPLINQTYGSFILSTYSTAYNAASGTDAEKHSSAKSTTSTIVVAYLSRGSYSSQVTDVAPYFIDCYLDDYHQSKTTDIRALSTTALPEAAEKYELASTASVGSFPKESLAAAAKDLVSDTLTQYRVIDDAGTTPSTDQKTDIARSTSKNALLTLVPSAQKEKAETMADIILDRYIAKPDLFDGNADDYRSISKAMAIAEVGKKTAVDYAYWEKLPKFTVKYLTDDKGYPIYYDSENKETEITKVSDRNLLVPVKEDMGTDSTFLEKQHKELITGTDYTDEEKTAAENDSKSYGDLGYNLIFDFLKKYIDSPSTYYDSTAKAVKDDAVKKEAIDYVNTQATQVILDQFKISSIDELTKQNAGISGSDLLDEVGDYSSSAIETYESRYASCISKGYDEETSMNVAWCKAGIGITDQLPSRIKSNLEEMGKMNMYAIIIALMFFDCSGLLLPMVYTMMTANDLIAGQVDSGSLAFILSTPTKRGKITFTQLIFLFSSIFLSYFLLYLTTLSARAIGVAAGSLDLRTSLTYIDILLDAVGGFAVIFAIGGICFMTSCFFDKTKLSLGVGGGLTIFFLVTSILGIFGSQAMPATIRIDAMNYFNYCTIIRLFDTQALIDHDYVTYGWKVAILFAIGLITANLGIIRFNKKDLPL
jgi:ABC-type transport system involved in multi-copper enzyme maturation permease subunit